MADELNSIRETQAELDRRIAALERRGWMPSVRVSAESLGWRPPSGERQYCFFPETGVHVFVYRTEAGGVWKTTVALVGHKARTPAKIENLRVTIDGHEYPIADRFALPPGWIWSRTWYSGPALDYWRARGEMKPCPVWAPEKLGQPEPYAELAPFRMAWHFSGWYYGGQGTEYPWADWRHCPEGYSRAFAEAEATAMRNPIAYLDKEGDPTWESSTTFVLGHGLDTPPGYHWSPDDVADWWPDAYELASWKKNDGWHLHRAYRAALKLRDIDPFCADYCSWMWKHISRAWGWDNARDGRPSNYWGAKQLVDYLRGHPGPHENLGRQFAHVCEFVWTYDPDSNLAADLQGILLLAADERTGVPMLNSSSTYAYWARKSHGGIFEEDEPIGMTREWIMLWMAARHRPNLRDWRRRLQRFMGSNPPGAMNIEGVGYGTPNGDWHLMFGDMGDKTLEEWIAAGEHRHVEANGAQMLNALPAEYAGVPGITPTQPTTMKAYRICLLIVVAALLAYVAKGDTVSQTVTVSQIDVLNGGTASIDVVQFDAALGTLEDVTVTYERFVFRSVFRVFNDTDDWIASYATGVTIVPWLDDGLWHWFPTMSFTKPMIPPPPCGPVFPIFPPHSAHWFDGAWDTSIPHFCNGQWVWYTPVSNSLLSPYSPDTDYWTGTSTLPFIVNPGWQYTISLARPWAPWPAKDPVCHGVWWESEVTIMFHYTPVTP